MSVAAIVIAGFALVVSGVTLLANQLWEAAKFSRSERATAYGALIAAESQRWEAYRDRDRQSKDGRRPGGSPPTEQEKEAVAGRIRESRARAFDALTLIRLLSLSSEVIQAADDYHHLMNRDNFAYFDSSKGGRVPGQERKDALWRFVHAARDELEHPLKRMLKRASPLRSQDEKSEDQS